MLPTIAPCGVRTFLRGTTLDRGRWAGLPAQKLKPRRHGDHRALPRTSVMIIRAGPHQNNRHDVEGTTNFLERKRRVAPSVAKHREGPPIAEALRWAFAAINRGSAPPYGPIPWPVSLRMTWPF